YTLSCTTAADIAVTTSDRFYVWVGVNLTAVASGNVFAQLDVEGTQGGNYDSRVVVPLVLSPTSGAAGTAVTIQGSNFGTTQGGSTLTFNGVAATPTSWSGTTIIAAVPSTATTGPIIVTVGGIASNGASFTVLPGMTNVSPSSGPVGTSVTLSGTAFGATQGGSTVTFNGVAATPTAWSPTSITVPVPAAATTGNVVVT